jgi:hypothetical protein
MKFARILIGLLCASAAAVAAVPDSDPQRPTPWHAAAPHNDTAAGISRARANSVRDSVESQHDVGGSPQGGSRPTSSAGGGFQSPYVARDGTARSSLHSLLETRARARGPARQIRTANTSAASPSRPDSRQADGATRLRSPMFPTGLIVAAPTTVPASAKPMTSLRIMPATGQPARIASRVRVPQPGGNSHTARIDAAEVHRGF